ncbi:hypothetical protein [Streptomyces sp. MP131-18]|uniref:hypothetical protein n=1 Tax=Streptomyces sp. MP131-18 TaxID=1857892 RepID=UPI00097C4B9D|nr:hypothetical protein [Streptomyces sp. MP131-18]ONK10171.1 hypothetical protein STBA_08930 [Streptomyces sp. MP131-18]
MSTGGSEREAAAGIAQLEGYLLWQAELAGARAEAEMFAARLTGLSEEQRAELADRYAEERIALSRRVLVAVADRCRGLQAEYTDRYRCLRRRVLCAAACAVLAAVGLAAGSLLLTTRG